MNIRGKVFQVDDLDHYKRILDTEINDRVCYTISFRFNGAYIDGPESVDLDEVESNIDKGQYKEVPDPLPKKFVGETIPDKERAFRDRKFSIIKPLISQKPLCYNKSWHQKEIYKIFVARKKQMNSPGLNRQTPEAEKEFTKYEIYTALRTYLIYGEKRNSLIPNTRYCGGRGKERTPVDNMLGRNKIYKKEVGKILTNEDKKNLKNGWWTYKVKNRENSIVAAYHEMICASYLGAKEIPSPSQFKYWGCKQNDPVKSAEETAGNINWSKDERVLTSGARVGIFGPGSQGQIDSTKDDTHVLSIVIHNTYIGRLTLFLLVDTYSGMIMGIALVPENSSNYSACLTLINAATDKVKFCAEHNIIIDSTQWPAKHLSSRILGDLGILFGEKSNNVTDLEILVSNTGAYRPDLKPIVERHIGKLLSGIKGILATHGLVNKRDSPRICVDTRTQAVLDYKSLMAIMIHQILYFIKHVPIKGYPMTDEMKRESLIPTSLNLWNFGIRRGYDALITEDPEELSIKLFEKKECSYGREGISFYGDRYMCVSKEGKDFFNKLVFGERPKTLTIKYNPMYTSQVYLSHGGEYFKLYRMAGDLNIQTFLEVANDIVQQKALTAATEAERIQAAALTKKNQRDILKAAKKLKGKEKIDIKNARSAINIDREHHRKTAMPEKEIVNQQQEETINYSKDLLKLPELLINFYDEERR